MRTPVTLFALVLLAAACHDTATKLPPLPDNLQRSIGASGWDSLPLAQTSNGQLLCAADGKSVCPVAPAGANWLNDGRFVTWEPERPIEIWSGHGEPVSLGDVGTNESQYTHVMSVASFGKGYAVIDAGQHGTRQLSYDVNRGEVGMRAVPPISPTFATVYSGAIPLLQRISSAGPGRPADFTVRLSDSPGDTLGRLMLKTPLPWLVIDSGRPAHALPLFPYIPSYAFARDSDIVWSPGDVRTVQRNGPDGVVRWRLTSPAGGDTIRPADIDTLRSRDRERAKPGEGGAPPAQFDSSVKYTGKTYPAFVGLLVAPDERVMLVDYPPVLQDSVTAYVLNRDGQPVRRFRLARRAHVLLFGGDSVLVQRVVVNSSSELRWLKVGVP